MNAPEKIETSDIAEEFLLGELIKASSKRFKALPALNFDNIGTFWIENGAAGQIKEAA